MARRQEAAGPSDFVSFDQIYGANAEGAKTAASNIASSVDKTATDAQAQLRQAYGDFKPEGGKAFDPGQAVQDSYAAALQQRNALKTDAGVQALAGGKANSLDAALIARAGAPQFQELQQKWSGLDTQVQDTIKADPLLFPETQGFAGVAGARSKVDEAKRQSDYEEHVAQKQAQVDADNAAYWARPELTPDEMEAYNIMVYVNGMSPEDAEAELLAGRAPDANRGPLGG